mmetsp:Transcript_14285/g.44967  ORF Transcript_14285/g.44967 Transcript_14285/m.44967 type:complete len:215 (+) Transcript_14285:388-1032(+)
MVILAAAITLANSSCSAGSRGRIGVVRACTVMAAAPASAKARMSATVLDTSSSRRILADTGFGCISLTSAATMDAATSGVFSRAAPIPPDTLKCFGHPMFRSMPATSAATTRAAATATSAFGAPIWHTRRARSRGTVRRTTSLPLGARNSTYPSCSTRVQRASLKEMISGVHTTLAPPSSAHSRVGKVPIRTRGASTVRTVVQSRTDIPDRFAL